MLGVDTTLFSNTTYLLNRTGSPGVALHHSCSPVRLTYLDPALADVGLHRGASSAADRLPTGRSLLVCCQLLLRMLLRAPDHSRVSLLALDI